MTKSPVLLIVDDAPGNIQALAECLKSDYQLKVANNGKRCLELARQHPRPDLILLDVSMPEMDGYEVLRHLKDDAALKDIPVIFVTGMTETSEEEKGFELGAVDYVIKPFRPSIIRARVRTHLTLKQQRDELENMAMCDQLTGLFNRRFLMESAKQKAAYARRHRQSLSVLMLDVDKFKAINDQHGHATGDLVLKTVAQTIQEHCREEDVVGRTGPEDEETASGDVVARYGGEEFVVLLTPCELAHAEDKSETLRRAIENLHPAGLDVTISIGVAQLTGEESFEALLSRADNALYQAKEGGRNRVAVNKG